MNITYKQINETLYKVFLEEEEFCLVSKFDNELEPPKKKLLRNLLSCLCESPSEVALFD